MIVTGFFDTYDKAIDKQIETAKHLNIKSLSIRYFGEETLKSIEDSQIKQLIHDFKKQKLSLDIVDSDYSYDIQSFDQAHWSILIDHAQKLNIKTLITHLPMIEEPLDHQMLLDHVKYLIESTKKKTFQLLFIANPSFKPGHIAYLINQIKGIKFIFDAGLIKMQKASVTTTYRIMKKNIQGFKMYDLEKNGMPALLGYGYTQVMDVLKKMRRDKYKGYIFIDFNLMSYLENRGTPKVKKGFFRFFNKKKKETEIYNKMDELLHVDTNQTLTYGDLMLVIKTIIEKMIDKKK